MAITIKVSTRSGRILLFTACFLLLACVIYFTRPLTERFLPTHYKFPDSHKGRPFVEPPRPSSILSAECRGARGNLIDDPLSEDLPRSVDRLRKSSAANDSDIAFPEPTFGSYEALGLEKTWMTSEQRYGPYGFGEEALTYPFTRANWSVNWGHLQDQCLLAAPNRTHELDFLQVNMPPRFRLVDDDFIDNTISETTGRQAIVLRSWETFEYKPEDLWNIRSIITEAGLATKGEYTVFLLVDVKREDGSRIHEDDDFYMQVLEECVPAEFRDMAVLFHKSLQHSWYPKVDEVSTIFQVMQPLQLFARFYPGFDHYWQIEMDTRFTGNVGNILNAFHKFSKDQPYKQSRERSSWTYIPRVHGTFEELSAQIDKKLDGDATVWGPVKTTIKGLKPVGPKPPVDNPKDDDFTWGVGEDADLLIYSPLTDVLRFETLNDWVFKDWRKGSIDINDPRFMSAPAQARASRRLLNAIHTAQHELGLAVPSEATLPTWAIWHGLQVVQVPMPKFQFPERDVNELNAIYNGGTPKDFKDGIADGPAPYHKHVITWFSRPRTWEWQSSLTDPTFDHWLHRSNKPRTPLGKNAPGSLGAVPDELPPFLEEMGGKVYAPSFMMHPRKTNRNR